MTSATQLSRNDLSVLSAIFDPEGTPSEILYRAQTASIIGRDDEVGHIREREAIAALQHEDPSQWDIRATISALDDVVRKHPRLASVYNNRAQARRMLHQCDDPCWTAEGTQLILEDLGQAIHLATEDSTSARQAQVLAAAHTHRGHLLYRASKEPKLADTLLGSEGVEDTDPKALEEMASKDFALGGRYGNKLAKQMAVMTNPYAKLCGQMVKQALADEAQGGSLRI